MYVTDFAGFSDQKVRLQLCVRRACDLQLFASISYVHIFNNLPVRGQILLFCSEFLWNQQLLDTVLYSAGLLLRVIDNTVNNSVEFNIPGFNCNYSMVEGVCRFEYLREACRTVWFIPMQRDEGKQELAGQFVKSLNIFHDQLRYSPCG